eukprot:5151466-Amphidinium_carterae.1
MAKWSKTFNKADQKKEPEAYRRKLVILRKACFFVRHVYAFLQSTAFASLNAIFETLIGEQGIVDM